MPLQFLWGDEDFLIDNAINKIKKEILKNDINPLNYRRVDNPDFAEFCQILRTPPMMFGDILYIIKCQSYFLETKSKAKLEDKQIQELIEAFKNIDDKVHIILVCPTPYGEKKKPDSRKKLFKEISKITKPQEFPSFKSWEDYKIIPEINKIAKNLDLEISSQNSSLLIQTTGSRLRSINDVLEKIKLLIHPNKKVDEQTIKKYATISGDIYDLIDSILLKNYASSLNLISQILQKEHYLPSLSFLQTTFSNLLKTKIYSNSYSSYDIAVKLGMNEFIVKKNLQKISSVPIEELVRIKINLEQAEYNLKSGTISDVLCAYEKAFLGDCL